MQVVHVDHAADGAEVRRIGRGRPRGRRLQEDPHRLPQQAPRPGRIHRPMAAPISGSAHVQPKLPTSTAARMTPADPTVSARTSSAAPSTFTDSFAPDAQQQEGDQVDGESEHGDDEHQAGVDRVVAGQPPGRLDQDVARHARSSSEFTKAARISSRYSPNVWVAAAAGGPGARGGSPARWRPAPSRARSRR